MNVLVVEPGYMPYEKEINGLKEMQAVVGGLIWPIHPFDDAVSIVSNDDALSSGQPFNRSVPGGYGGIFGPFFICGEDGENFCSLTPEQMEKYKQYFSKAELLLGVNGNNIETFKFPAEIKRETKKPHEQNQDRSDR